MTWPGATLPPNNNQVGLDPQLIDPENGDFRVRPGSPAEGYGCQTFVPASPRTRESAEDGPAADSPAIGRRGTIPVSGAISSDDRWDADTIMVAGEITVEEGITLTIRPGTCVFFEGRYALTVMGRLSAVGTPEERIVFTCGEAARAGDGVALGRGRSSSEGNWKGIRFPGTSSLNDSTRMAFCVIENARAPDDASFGGALYFDGFSKASITNSIIRGNEADYGGAVFLIRQASPRFSGNLIEGNSARITASAVYSIDSYPSFVNCTIVNNLDLNPEPSWATAAFVNFISRPRTTGCVIWDNPSAYFLPTQMIEPKAFYTTYNDVDGGLPGEGNIDLDPLFAGDGDHPYRLDGDSPCRDAAAPAAAGLPRLDLAGSLRVVGARADIGAYEWIDPSRIHDGPEDAARGLSVDPNPSRAACVFRFTLPARTPVEIAVYDPSGRRVRSIPGGFLDGGPHAIPWDGRNEAGSPAAPGCYVARLSTAGGSPPSVKVTITR